MAVLLTLICPVYRASAHIPALIDSLIAGANSDQVTVLFVDDASPDDSRAVGQARLAERAAEVRFQAEWLVQPHNQGVAAARNLALDHVTSPYVGMVDADDLIDPAYLSVLRPLMAQRRWDIIEFAHREFHGEAPTAMGSAGAPPEGRLLPSSQLNPFETGFFSWTRLYAAPLLATLRYPSGTLYEDVRFVAEAFARSRHSVRLGQVLVHYRRHGSSITSVQARDRRYADQMHNLVTGALSGLAQHRQPRRLLQLLAPRCVRVLLKGLRIRVPEERRAFLQACQAPLAEVAAALEAMPAGWRAQAWLWLAQRLAGSPRGPAAGSPLGSV